MGVESYCVKFYLVHDLWRAWLWGEEEIGTRCLDHGGACVWLYLGCICEAGVRVYPPVGKFSTCSGLPLAPDGGKQVQEQIASAPRHLFPSRSPDCGGHYEVF